MVSRVLRRYMTILLNYNEISEDYLWNRACFGWHFRPPARGFRACLTGVSTDAGRLYALPVTMCERILRMDGSFLLQPRILQFIMRSIINAGEQTGAIRAALMKFCSKARHVVSQRSMLPGFGQRLSISFNEARRCRVFP